MILKDNLKEKCNIMKEKYFFLHLKKESHSIFGYAVIPERLTATFFNQITYLPILGILETAHETAKEPMMTRIVRTGVPMMGFILI